MLKELAALIEDSGDIFDDRVVIQTNEARHMKRKYGVGWSEGSTWVLGFDYDENVDLLEDVTEFLSTETAERLLEALDLPSEQVERSPGRKLSIADLSDVEREEFECDECFFAIWDHALWCTKAEDAPPAIDMTEAHREWEKANAELRAMRKQLT